MSTLPIADQDRMELPFPTGFSISRKRLQPVVVPVEHPLRRRPTREQGRALEMLAHAIEYLADSYMVKRGGLMNVSRSPELEAVQILMELNREVFAGCRTSTPLLERLLRILPLGIRRVQVVGSTENELHR